MQVYPNVWCCWFIWFLTTLDRFITNFLLHSLVESRQGNSILDADKSFLSLRKNNCDRDVVDWNLQLNLDTIKLNLDAQTRANPRTSLHTHKPDGLFYNPDSGSHAAILNWITRSHFIETLLQDKKEIRWDKYHYSIIENVQLQTVY